MTARKSSVKSEAQVARGRASAAALDRDPVTHRFVRRGEAPPAPAADAPAAPVPDPAIGGPHQAASGQTGGGAPAPSPFHGFLGRHRRR